MTEVLRVVIADDHAPTRESVREALEADGCVVVADVPDAVQALAAAVEHRPDVCVLDIHMPGSGIVAAAKITQALPDTKVVMLTASQDDEDLFDALRVGASGYLPKDMDPGRIAAALRGVLAGEAALPRWLALKVMQQFRADPGGRFSIKPKRTAAHLTPKETEILELMAEGLSTEDIAKKLYVAQVTVRTHISMIIKKLRVTDRAAAIRLARGEG